MCDCFRVAEYFLSMQDGDAGNAISNMKLQKLLYYAQGFAMVILERPLFEDNFEAWECGPVVRKIYDKYNSYGSNALPKPDDFSLHKYSKEEKEFLNEIYDVYGQYSAWALNEMAYKTSPWKDTPRNSIISKVSMKKYFSTRIVED